MSSLRDHIIRTGLGTLSVTGLHHLLKPFFGGAGAIFMLHHVRPGRNDAFQPNRLLEITPEFLRTTLAYLRREKIDLITLDEMRRRLLKGDTRRRFACFTFDDGYRDNRDHALPVMQEFGAPFTVYVASDFAAGTGRLWWVALERLIARNDHLSLTLDGAQHEFDTATPEAKQKTFARLNQWVVANPDDRAASQAIGIWCRQYGIDVAAISAELCMSWDELRAFSSNPLVEIGAHTITHCNLAKQIEATARAEMHDSRTRIETELARKVAHFAYPYGYASAAGAREFVMAQNLGFSTAVTTRPGMIFPEHAKHLTALPRISLNGNYPEARFLPALTSGAATALWNRFRRLDVD